MFSAKVGLPLLLKILGEYALAKLFTEVENFFVRKAWTQPADRALPSKTLGETVAGGDQISVYKGHYRIGILCGRAHKQ